MALVVGEAQAKVGVDRVEPAILELVGAQLVGQPDPAALLAKIEQYAAAGLTDQPQRLLQLRPAIAFEAAEHIAGQTLTVQTHQRRPAAERADQQRDMILAGGGIPERHHLRRRQPVERQRGAGDDFRGWPARGIAHLGD